MVARRYQIYLGAGAAFVLRHKAEAAVVLGRGHLVGAWSGEVLREILEA